LRITCLIIDDEPLARKRIFSLVENIPKLDFLDEAKTGKEAIVKIENLLPDLIFLDIQMKDMTGFEVLKKAKPTKKPVVIFVTAYDEYALKAFDFFAFDYLLKPFKKGRFNLAVKRVIKYINSKNNDFDEKIDNLLKYMDNSVTKKDNRIFKNKLAIKTGKNVSFIDINSIKYIIASGSYVDIHTNNRTPVLRTTLSAILEKIDNLNFIRIHRSTIININFIDKLIHSNYSEIDVKMSDEKIFRISKSYKKEFQNILDY
jgi:two-component system LytT family response regulator